MNVVDAEEPAARGDFCRSISLIAVWANPITRTIAIEDLRETQRTHLLEVGFYRECSTSVDASWTRTPVAEWRSAQGSSAAGLNSMESAFHRRMLSGNPNA